jgi:hypothetical protein
MKTRLSLSGNGYEGGGSNTGPGASIGKGLLAKIVANEKALIVAVGNRVRAFATGSFDMPVLERAWCDAAYWLHQGLAEPLSAIAIVKLETAFEVLFCAKSRRGSERRILEAIDTFYGLQPHDRINAGSETTCKDFAKRFVDHRSRILHGTSSTLNSNLRTSEAPWKSSRCPLFKRA